MRFERTDIDGLVVVEPTIFEDNRGYFYEAYNENAFRKEGLPIKFVQDNQSKSSYGVIRGLHYQLNPFAQTKLVRVLEGKIIDVAVDIRKRSPTYGKSFSIELSAENKRQLYIPAGFAHGFSVLSAIAIVFYKCDQFYNKDCEGGVRFDDIDININWGIPKEYQVISEKDAGLPIFKESVNNFDLP